VNRIRVPFALSLLGHAVLLALLALFVTRAPRLPLPPASAGIVVTFAASLPQPQAPPAAPPPTAPAPPPPSPPPVAAVEPPPPLPPPPALSPEPPLAEPPPLPPRKPAVRPMRPMLRRPERLEQRRPAEPVPTPVPAPAAPTPQTAAARLAAPPSDAVGPGYRALLGAWLESHKRYPETARERGEEGRAVLQFAVDRSGRVIDFAVIRSSGYPDLDAAVEAMMRGASLPPFPADMPQSSIRVSVAIRFSLAR
jgi:protein TonB